MRIRYRSAYSIKIMKCFFSILFLPLFLIGATAHAKPAILLTPIPLKKIDSVATWDILRTLQISLKKKKIKTELATPLASTSVSSGKNTSLENSLKKAQDLQFNFNNKGAIKVLQQALGSFDQKNPTLKDLQKLADAHLFLAYCYKNIGNTSSMNKSLDEAARLNPSLIPDEMLFPPSLARQFERAKDRIWSRGKFSKIMIESSPSGAQIFVNGSYKGKAPLRLDRYPVGAHHVIAKLGKKEDYQKVILKGAPSHKLVLKPGTARKRRSRKKETAISVSSLKSQSKWLENYASLRDEKEIIGIGVVKKGKKLQVAVHKVGAQEFKPQIIKVSSSDSSKVIVSKIVDLFN